ncbi:hypothetical protein UCREL1_10542 [Eutypa lata UCREL1]|uniref:Uncharacterized protein n=1 Tax=Eutypa lata (strain UCR-EL1) TaxID=1287681 RepID=M7T792_EUTLA|nr:hypothetical protein UCREL1_10542 [Eutypa lata UCREL1]
MTTRKQPWIPRMHLFEIDDQPWFPSFLRAHVQAGLTHAWNFRLPPLQASTPAALVAETLRRTLGGDGGAAKYTYIDFCAGAGGPTPDIERALNERLLVRQNGSSATSSNGSSTSSRAPSSVNGGSGGGPSYAAVASTESTLDDSRGKAGKKASRKGKGGKEETGEDGAARFVLTDLHPHAAEWAAACKRSENLSYIADPVDASDAPADLIARYTAPGKKVFRLYNLAFHHFDDGLARAMLRNTIETSDGFGIFELQERSINSFITCFIFGIFSLFIAPFYYYSYYFTSPSSLFFIYVVPIVPFVLVFDGLVSSVRTRTPTEVEALLQTCGADTTGWELKSGRQRFLWPTGYMSWIICTKK